MTVSDPTEVTPALFDHAKRVYDEMQSRGRKEPAHKEAETEVDAMVPGDITVYEGHLTRLFSDLGIANPYYTKIMDVLKAQGCVDQIRRGGGAAMSKWQLIRPPDEEGFQILVDRKRRPKSKAGVMEQRVNDLMKLCSSMQDTLDRHDMIIQNLARKEEERYDKEQMARIR
jgi:hypothetical protein